MSNNFLYRLKWSHRMYIFRRANLYFISHIVPVEIITSLCRTFAVPVSLWRGYRNHMRIKFVISLKQLQCSEDLLWLKTDMQAHSHGHSSNLTLRLQSTVQLQSTQSYKMISKKSGPKGPFPCCNICLLGIHWWGSIDQRLVRNRSLIQLSSQVHCNRF